MSDLLGIVVIGRNEGARLVRSLQSMQPCGVPIVYVDSGSSDGSPARAEALGVHVHVLDPARPFSAARARNEGFEVLLRRYPDLAHVQFVDGDCELRAGWFKHAIAAMRDPDVAIVAGRRREKFPQASLYNTLADMEWDTPIGDATEIGGDALVRASVFQAVGGYDPALIAGEDPDLCYRVRRAGHRVLRIDAEMTLHDADLHALKQWWTRATRAGHAFAEGAYMHGAEEERYRVKELRSILFWGGLWPTMSLALSPLTLGGSLALGAGGYSLLASKIYKHRRAQGDPIDRAAIYAGGVTLGKLAEMRGALQFAYQRFVRRDASTLIEYKDR